MASGYLKVIHYEFNMNRGKAEYDLKLTNLEVQIMFKQMIESWFNSCRRVNNAFLQTLLSGEIKATNSYMNKVAKEMFGYFDTGKKPSEEEPELSDTVLSALRQIEEKDYQTALIARAILEERIRKYGFAFCVKHVLIDGE